MTSMHPLADLALCIFEETGEQIADRKLLAEMPPETEAIQHVEILAIALSGDVGMQNAAAYEEVAQDVLDALLENDLVATANVGLCDFFFLTPYGRERVATLKEIGLHPQSTIRCSGGFASREAAIEGAKARLEAGPEEIKPETETEKTN